MGRPFEEFDERLGDLWSHRDTLTRPEGNELYELVCTILSRMNFPLYRALPELEPFDCIHMFFEDKVLKNPARGRRMHGGGLIRIYNNYLIDLYRARQRTVEHMAVSVVGPEGGPSDLAEVVSDPAADEAAFSSLDEKRLASSARTFLERLDEVGRVYLTENFCARGEAPDPLRSRQGLPDQELSLPSKKTRDHRA